MCLAYAADGAVAGSVTAVKIPASPFRTIPVYCCSTRCPSLHAGDGSAESSVTPMAPRTRSGYCCSARCSSFDAGDGASEGSVTPMTSRTIPGWYE